MMKIDKTTRQLLRDPDKRRAWVKYQIHMLGSSMAQLAEEAGVSRQCLYQAFCKSYPRMEKVIADALELEPKVLWPERYDADGLPLYRMGRPKKSISKTVKNNTPKRGRNVHKQEAA
ncbi:MAG: helix-turn-helix domain-containing protein [Chromatiales bacterium]|nr:helix-turn-helix domain-containing protein [Chromatiales bacterium]